MSDPKPTPAQLLVLSAADAGALYQSGTIASLGQPFAKGSFSGAIIQKRTVDICVKQGRLRLGEQQGIHRPWLLTDKGRAALARWGGAA